MSGVVFDNKSAKRIAAAVRKVEGEAVDLSSTRTPAARHRMNLVWVYVDSAAAGGGKYYGRLAFPPTGTLSASGTLSLADLCTVSTVNVLIFNAAEQGQDTHDLTDATPRQRLFQGVIIGTSSDDPSLPVVRIGSVDAGDCAAGA